MHQSCAIHGDAANESALDQAGDDGPQAHLDNVAAESPNNHFLAQPSTQDGGDRLAQIVATKNARQGGEKFRKPRSAAVWPRELAHTDFALPAG